jgi:hypothetical protein
MNLNKYMDTQKTFAEIGIAKVLVNALRGQVLPSSLPSACAALKECCECKLCNLPIFNLLMF